MTSENKLPTITKVLINYCDRNVKIGHRSNVNSLTVNLEGLSQEVKDRLWHIDGKIEPAGSFMGPFEGTGMLFYQLDDTFDGKDIELGLDADNKQKNKRDALDGKVVKFSTVGWNTEHTNVSETSEFIVIQTFLKDEKKPYVEIHPFNRRLAVFEDPKYGSATIKLEGSKFWGAVEMYYHIPNEQYTNYIGNNGFSYLNLKEGMSVNLSDKLFHHVPAAAMGGGNDSEVTDKKIVDELFPKIVSADKTAKQLRNAKPHDSTTIAKLMSDSITAVLGQY
jgi:hypothetical protein